MLHFQNIPGRHDDGSTIVSFAGYWRKEILIQNICRIGDFFAFNLILTFKSNKLPFHMQVEKLMKLYFVCLF